VEEETVTQRLDYQKLSAAGLRAFGGVYVYIVNSGLPKALIDLVFLRASQINGCAYCIDMHSRDLLKGGASVEKVMLVSAWREAGDIFTAKEKAALQWTEAVTLVSQSHVPDEAFAAVSAEFQPKEVSDLTLGIGVINVYNRLSIGFRRPPGDEAAA
jgi:AhpD family alkylhydroperoxidase